ncbi:hypothetical protein Y032_0077g1135 [Ancylostoma ceylanicum]|uniref:Uncharacterized protein n=1 Tax=Ancylostoma ceylanicum TaxID=53326 RepID=A0A016TU25_9BILA|nr:hypothetical protein Y032_0077g1135 [Ancylostoma ceylanicum]
MGRGDHKTVSTWLEWLDGFTSASHMVRRARLVAGHTSLPASHQLGQSADFPGDVGKLVLDGGDSQGESLLRGVDVLNQVVRV